MRIPTITCPLDCSMKPLKTRSSHIAIHIMNQESIDTGLPSGSPGGPPRVHTAIDYSTIISPSPLGAQVRNEVSSILFRFPFKIVDIVLCPTIKSPIEDAAVFVLQVDHASFRYKCKNLFLVDCLDHAPLLHVLLQRILTDVYLIIGSTCALQ